MIYFLVKDYSDANLALPLTAALTIRSGLAYDCDKSGDSNILNYLRREFGDIERALYTDAEISTIDKYPVILSVQEIFSRAAQVHAEGKMLVDLTNESGVAVLRKKAETHRLNKKFERGIA